MNLKCPYCNSKTNIAEQTNINTSKMELDIICSNLDCEARMVYNIIFTKQDTLFKDNKTNCSEIPTSLKRKKTSNIHSICCEDAFLLVHKSYTVNNITYIYTYCSSCLSKYSVRFYKKHVIRLPISHCLDAFEEQFAQASQKTKKRLVNNYYQPTLF